MTQIVVAVALGFAAGIVSGLFGVGGGIVFVPVLTLALGIGQLQAEATSLAAIVPVVAMGTFRQSRAGLVRWRDATVIGVLSLGGVLAGAALATSLGDRTLARGFGVLLLVVAGQTAVRAWRRREDGA